MGSSVVLDRRPRYRSKVLFGCVPLRLRAASGALRSARGLHDRLGDLARHLPQRRRPVSGDEKLDVLKAYLPAEASEAEIDQAVTKALAETGAATPKDMGKAMKAAMAALQAAGKPADGKKVNDAVRRRLGA